jgi:hypothetical protein
MKFLVTIGPLKESNRSYDVVKSMSFLLQCFMPHSKPVQVLPSFTFTLMAIGMGDKC